MKLLHSALDEAAKACLLATQLAGIRCFSAKLEPSVPIVTLQLEAAAHHSEEILGELSICRYLMAQCPWPKQEHLALEEWFLYELKPKLAGLSKKTIKSASEVLELLERLEASAGEKFIGGDHPCAADVLSIAYLHQFFTGDSWMVKKYPKLVNSFNLLRDSWKTVVEDCGGSLASSSHSHSAVFSRTVRLSRGLSPGTPGPGRRNVLVTSALPYVNNVPHLGNIIGCVLSADVFARYCRQRGYNTLYICGTDEYGTATETRAILEGLTPQEICDKYYQVHKDVYEWFDIDFNYFGRTTTQAQTEIAQGIFHKLHQNQELLEDEVQQSFCEPCNRFLADRFVGGTCPHCGFEQARGDQCDNCAKLLTPEELLEPKCFLCRAAPVPRTSKHLFINLPLIKDRLVAWIEASSQKGKWSANCMSTTQAWIRDGLKPRCITRDLQWGTPVPLAEYSKKVFYVWFDAPIGYLSITANFTEDWAKWWKNPNEVELVQFMGKDNVPFHTVIFPCSLIGTQENYTLLSTISTTEYLNYEDGKFSKTHQRGVFGDDAISTGIPSEVYRYYLLKNRPEQADTIFKWTDLQLKNNNELLANLGNFCNRVLKTLEKLKRELGTPGTLQPEDHECLAESYRLVQSYCQHLEDLKLKGALELAMEASALGNKYLQDTKMWEARKTSEERFQTLLVVSANLVRLVGLLIEPFLPSFAAKLYMQFGIERTEREETLLKTVIEAGAPEVILALLAPTTVVKQALPIIKAIKDEEIQALREKFKGSN